MTHHPTLAEVYTANEQIRKHGWVWAVESNEACDVCRALDGKKFPPSKKFEIAHPNCRCEALPAPQEGKRI